MRRFSLYKRNEIFYVRFWNPETKKYTSAISTGERERRYAETQAAYWDQHGIDDRDHRSVSTHLAFDTLLTHARTADLTREQVAQVIAVFRDRGLVDANPEQDPQGRQPLLAFLTRFWDFDSSPYVKEKIAFGHTIGRRHCYEQSRRLHHWREYFGDTITLAEVTREQLQSFQLSLRQKLAAKTANAVLSAGTTALAWSVEQGTLATNPAERLRKFSGTSRKRGILSPQDARGVFQVAWNDNRARVGNLVAMTCGLRAGEVIALRREDIGDDRLHVRHSWSFADGLKAPKNGEVRTVPLLREVRDELLKLADSNHKTQSPFVFAGPDPKKPMHADALTRGLEQAYLDMKAPKQEDESETDCKQRREEARRLMKEDGICFHSWRHFYATHMADRVELRAVQLATGHRSPAMAQHYADHAQDEHFSDVAQATIRAFTHVIAGATEQAS